MRATLNQNFEFFTTYLKNIPRIAMSFECGISTPEPPEIHNAVISAVFSKGTVTKVEITHFDPIFIPLLINQKI